MKHDDSFGYILMSGFLILLGLLGLVMASQAVDALMMAFGLALAVFAVFFAFFAINRTHNTPGAE
ncbi:MAG: hypothetical protein OJJ21_05340 [Ferrovibrio sp.]|uniref:hypothetical protein n=1 Tax=Ferrovibrio sp. TaxID=1917215 RepID=UPI002618DF84|nr:hypothetical protein [Ferrovibrio sp.]MCW0233005.1 hypothetical protein [Ferrovibrio sp.]